MIYGIKMIKDGYQKMRYRNGKKTNKKKKLEIVGSILGLIIFILIAIFSKETDIVNQITNNQSNINESQTTNNVKVSTNSNLEVYFIDVGQADSILIKNKKESMLIDAGNNEDGKDVVNFIKEKGINKLNYVIGTHPHEDHIGGLDDVINSDIEIQNILMPKIQTNTETFENVLDAISNRGIKVTSPSKGDVFQVGESKCEIMIDSILDKDNLNLSSIVIRLEFGKNSILFMGDSEIRNEETRNWPKTDVLKVGHHGSLTSSSECFLNQVKPSYAIIMVGKDNTYNLPKQEIIERLNKIGTQIYRTDDKGTIKMVSDGNKINILE